VIDARRDFQEGFTMVHPKYDVAISFLSADESIAAALNSALSDGLDVFFYPQKQEALAGKDGLEAMRMPFLVESRISVACIGNHGARRNGPAWNKQPFRKVALGTVGSDFSS
jgi:hypothetical protein